MSLHSGDRARANRIRRQKLQRRLKSAALQAAQKPASTTKSKKKA